MNIENIKSDKMFMKFIKNRGSKKVYDTSDFRIGDKVITVPLKRNHVFIDSSGHQIFINNKMAKDSLNGEVLKIREITGNNGRIFIRLSNGWMYLPEMIEEII